MKIIDAFNEAAPQLWLHARHGFRHAVMFAVERDGVKTVLTAAFIDANEAKQAMQVLRGFGLYPVRLELQGSEKPEDCLKSYYVPPTPGFGSFS
jgi:hypothetical protein